MRSKREQGQTIIIVVISLFVLTAMAALIIDGGNAFLNRRNAQTAADAGALAGAIEYCLRGNDPTDVITEYVQTHNDAVLESWAIVDDNIVVTVKSTNANFFAQIFGEKTTTVRAEAAASCFSVGFAGGLLPVAWTCRPPIDDDDLLGGGDCAMKGVPHDVIEELKSSGFDFEKDLLDEGDGVNASTYINDVGGSSEPKMVYLVADSLTADGLLEDSCKELNLPDTPPPDGDNGIPPFEGTITCDFDNDGIIDIDGGSRRGWLLMDGDENQGAAILKSIISGDTDVSTSTPFWYAGLTGGKATAFGEIRDIRMGDYALIPVFDAVCDTDDPVNDNVNCPEYYGSGEDVVYTNGTADYLYFRVNGFAVFYISCVSKVHGDKCPGKERAMDFGVVDHNTSTVEGYFVEYYMPKDVGIGENALDLGVYVISLTK